LLWLNVHRWHQSLCMNVNKIVKKLENWSDMKMVFSSLSVLTAIFQVDLG